MNAERHEYYEFTFTVDEAVTLANIAAKLARPVSGFQRPKFTGDEHDFISRLDKLCNPQTEQTDGPNVNKIQ